jgi:integrase
MAEAANRAVPTFGQVADEYLAAHAASWRSDRHRWQWRQTVTEHCAPIRDLPVNEIDVEAVLRTLTPLWAKTPTTASRLRGRIETILDAARARGHIPADKANPARWRGQLQHLLPNPKKISAPTHHPAMPWRDVPAFFGTLKASPESAVAMALAFTILTAMRSKEVRLTAWDEIDLDAATWTIPADRMKMRKPHAVPLSDAAVEILRGQLKTRGKSKFVFPGARPAQPVSINALMTALRRRGAGEFTVHGMRAAFRSWCADQGVAFELAEAALAHAPGNAVVQAYQRSSMLDRRRPVMQAWTSFLAGGAEANVVPLKRA